MKSPCTCGHGITTVIDSRDSKSGRRRRYECPLCNKRWTTMEFLLVNGKPDLGPAMSSVVEADRVCDDIVVKIQELEDVLQELKKSIKTAVLTRR